MTIFVTVCSHAIWLGQQLLSCVNFFDSLQQKRVQKAELLSVCVKGRL